MCEQVKLSFVDVVHQLEIKGSYTTSYQCSDGSYALITGADLTLEYDYGYTYNQVRISYCTSILFSNI